MEYKPLRDVAVKTNRKTRRKENGVWKLVTGERRRKGKREKRKKEEGLEKKMKLEENGEWEMMEWQTRRKL